MDQSLNLPSSLRRVSQGSGRHSNMMNPGPYSKMSHQGSRGVGSFNSDPETSKILANFGLSSRDLEELSHYPEEKITPENLPQIIEDIKRRRSEDMAVLSLRERSSREPLRLSSDTWDDTRPFRRENFNDRSSGLDPAVDFDHRSHSQDPAYRGRLEFEGRQRERERLREEHFPSGGVFKKFRGRPSNRNIKDFNGLTPKIYPYLCSLCDAHILNQKSWNLHVSGRLHSEQRQLLLDKYPEWEQVRHGPGDSYRQQSTNAAAGIHMGGGPEGRSGGHKSYLGNEAMPGPRLIQKRQEAGRVVHVMGIRPGKTLKYELLKLAEPFGVITNYVIIHKTREAFIEMSTPKEAKDVVNFFSTHTALLLGKRVKVFMSRKYETIKKPNGKDDDKPEPKPEVGRVLQLRNLPRSGYSDTALVKLAEAHGKVKTYIIMRAGKQAFIEMEKAEDANAMVEHCAKTPLMFRGNALKVEICTRYKTLVLKFPNKNIEQQKGINRKRALSPDNMNDTKKKKTESSQKAESGDENESQMVTTEEADQEETDEDNTGINSCEPELKEKDEVAAVASSSSGDKAEMDDTSQLDLNDPGETQGPNTSTPIAKVTDVKKKKPESKADDKPEQKQEVGRVLQLSNLPFTGYADSAIWRMAKGYGNVKTYILMRRKNLAFVEMEKAEDAQTMVKLCAKLPILFRGKKVKVAICKSYKNLQKFPNRWMEQKQKEKNRTRGPLTNFKNSTKSSRKAESSDGENKSQMVTTEEETDQKDAVTKSCDTEEGEAAIMETSSSIVDNAEMVDTSEVDTQDKTGIPTTSTEGKEAEQENKIENAKICETSESTTSQVAPGSVSAAETDCSKDLGPYKSNNPVGVEYVVPGFYCKLCSLFYTTEKMAKVTHCSGLPHYQKLKKTLSDVPEKKN